MFSPSVFAESSLFFLCGFLLHSFCHGSIQDTVWCSFHYRREAEVTQVPYQLLTCPLLQQKIGSIQTQLVHWSLRFRKWLRGHIDGISILAQSGLSTFELRSRQSHRRGPFTFRRPDSIAPDRRRTSYRYSHQQSKAQGPGGFCRRYGISLHLTAIAAWGRKAPRAGKSFDLRCKA